ncbi:DUF2637 domain-containing protein [Streptomyces sp. NBC_00006]|uniref:DUF2637 domain-containing protein n=1 Tax=unclassified Streptomyces TaxID=2593676 RepID=UPI00224D79C9|nr:MULTISPECIES: DUF2637 domain-containing protein [unclassified Streptomyces]MCX4827951.1 DUF2637 domain-containing protein [Streptomyces sp. NBC_01016]MCX5532694.1 DUF2637 domain-containing protein [Streptomyces sp. NBC_00006]
MPSRTTPTAGTAAIRAGIALLAAFAFALSYDALRQMAVAIHIRGLLTYAFPLVIDGFIAIGVGALLMLRTAPTPSRAYVWALVGAATVTSIWANALHAVRLNELDRHSDSLQLDDLTVGALSAIAPLALAGAVHLYLVVRRHPTPSRRDSADQPSVDVAAATADVASGAISAASSNAKMAEASKVRTPANELALDSASADRFGIARAAPLGRNERASRRHIEATFRDRGLTIGRQEADRLKDFVQAELDTAAPETEQNAITVDAV